jgi:CPA2 family monovalent cation:H+ antiporter-2
MLAFLFLGRRLLAQINRLLDIPSDEVFMLVLFAILTITAGFRKLSMWLKLSALY